MPRFNAALSLSCDPEQLMSGIVIGVSGGVDSVMLLHSLVQQARKTDGARLVVAHVNYQLRKAAEGDEALVRKLTKHHDLPCKVKRCRKPPRGRNLHDWAREVRYTYFAKLAAQYGCEAVAVAHHKDDQAETVLWHLLRGTGLGGLSGMAPRRPLTEGTELIRPLLGHSRAEIEAYAKRHRLTFRRDATNTSRRFTRGRIRTELLPQCDAIHTGAAQHIAALADRLAHDEAYLTEATQRAWVQLKAKEHDSEVLWERRPFLGLPKALRVRILQLGYETVTGSKRHLAADHLRKMDEVAKEGGQVYCLPGPCLFRRDGKHCRISRGSLRFGRGHDTLKSECKPA